MKHADLIARLKNIVAYLVDNRHMTHAATVHQAIAALQAGPAATHIDGWIIAKETAVIDLPGRPKLGYTVLNQHEEASTKVFASCDEAMRVLKNLDRPIGWVVMHISQLLEIPPPKAAEPVCSPTLTECPRCKNNIAKCDGLFATASPQEAALSEGRKA